MELGAFDPSFKFRLSICGALDLTVMLSASTTMALAAPQVLTAAQTWR